MSNDSDHDPVEVLDLGEGRDEAASVAVGDRFEIRTRAPGGTGYLWDLEIDEARCRIVSREVVANTETFGGSGTARFVVEAVRPGTAELRLCLQAPWETEPAREYRVRLEVAG